MNYYFAISCLLALYASANADGSWGTSVYAPAHASVDYYAYPRYAFDYSVNDPHTGDNKAQWEKRDGDLVKGAYSLVEPDGSLRVVEYWADAKSGFNAVVKRIGPNLHPTTIPAAPIYKAPIPVLSHASVAPIAPISIGSISKLSGLASAPLISGPIYGGAVSTASLYKAPAVSVPAPVLPATVYKTQWPAPAPIVPVLPEPIIKSAPILSGPLPGSAWGAPLPLLKGPIGYQNIAPLSPWGDALYKGGLAASSYYDDLGQGLISKGHILPSWSPLNYNIGLEYKH